MGDQYEEYRRQAKMCQEFADRAATPKLQADWLELAFKWLEMIPLEERDGAPAVDPSAPTIRTSQGPTKPSH